MGYLYLHLGDEASGHQRRLGIALESPTRVGPVTSLEPESSSDVDTGTVVVTGTAVVTGSASSRNSISIRGPDHRVTKSVGRGLELHRNPRCVRCVELSAVLKDVVDHRLGDILRQPLVDDHPLVVPPHLAASFLERRFAGESSDISTAPPPHTEPSRNQPSAG